MSNSSEVSYPFNRLPERLLEAKRKLNFLLLWAGVLGVLVGLLASSFRFAVKYLLSAREQLSAAIQDYTLISWLIPSIVSGGMVYLSFYLMRRFAPETAGSGIPQIEGTLDDLLPLRWQRVLPVKFFGGILSLGAGMIAGFEGPTIQMGGSLGKMLGHFVHTTSEQTKILIACGAGAGLAAAFNAPIAGILFITEEVRPQFESWNLSYRCLMISSVTATLVVRIFFGQDSFLKIEHYQRVPLKGLWMFVILGVALGIIGYIFNHYLLRSLDWFSQLRGPAYKYLGLVVGSLIGLLGILYSPLTGSGDNLVILTLNNQEPGSVLLLIFIARFIIFMICYGSGEIGGIFAPMLSLATLFSLGMAKTLHDWFPLQIPEPGVFSVAGMGGLVAATVRAPLTAMMLTMELTDNYFVMIPMLITCLFAAMTAHLLGGEPIYSVLLRRLIDKQNS